MMEHSTAQMLRAGCFRGVAFLVLFVLILAAGCGWRPKVNGFTEGGLQRNF